MPEVDSYRQQRTCGNCAFCYFAGLEERQAVMRCYFADGEAVEIDHICDGHEWKNKREIKMKIEFDWTKEKPKVSGYYFVCPKETKSAIIRYIEPGHNDHLDDWFSPSEIEMPDRPEKTSVDLRWTHDCCLNCKHFDQDYNFVTSAVDADCKHPNGPESSAWIDTLFTFPYYAAVQVCDLHEKKDD